MDIKKLVSQMTLEEKAALCQGSDFWHTVGVERLDIPRVMVSDGPHGLRKQDQSADNLGINDSIKAVCYPTAAGTASSWDPALLEEMGTLLGDSCQAEDVAVILGPAANIKRSPLCGRNFEYFSEDPYLSGEIAAAHIRGVQSRGIGTSLKHFAANSQETRRMSVNERISERALREIYLASFEGAVKGGKPWTVMCSYNQVNGDFTSQSKWLLTDILRDEWGFDGLVMTDWGACVDHVKGIAAGLELEMPRFNDEHDQQVVEAVRSGKLPEAVLDQAVERLLQLVDRYQSNRRPDTEFDRGMQHHQARKIARDAMVLLKNDNNVLPIRGNKKVAFIGAFAEAPRFQGGGSSHINCAETTGALDAVRSVCPVTYAKGFSIENEDIDPALEQEALEAAKAADVVVIFAGLPDAFESEGYDRRHLRMPANQNRLIEAIAAVQPNLAVVLHNGAPVEMPWADKVPAVLEAYLGGEAGGGAVVDLLFGAVSPSGKLAETFPLRLEDTPCYLNFPGYKDDVDYAEDIWVGYRYYDKKNMPVLFPFGHGLSYTTFAYSNLRLSAEGFNAEKGDTLTVQVDVTNTGSVAGAEIVQIYVKPEIEGGMPRPVRELKGFGKVMLAPGETKTVTVTLDSRAFSYWNDKIHSWYAEAGCYVIEAAASSRDIRLAAEVAVENRPLPVTITMCSTLKDVKSLPKGQEYLGRILQGNDIFGGGSESANEAISPEMMEAMFGDMPLHSISNFMNPNMKIADVEAVIAEINRELQG